jgi:hypothetical protein
MWQSGRYPPDRCTLSRKRDNPESLKEFILFLEIQSTSVSHSSRMESTRWINARCDILPMISLAVVCIVGFVDIKKEAAAKVKAAYLGRCSPHEISQAHHPLHLSCSLFRKRSTRRYACIIVHSRGAREGAHGKDVQRRCRKSRTQFTQS